VDEPEPVAPGVVDVEPAGEVVVSVDELGDDGVVEGEVVGGGVVVGGEADGTRSPGRSLVRGVSASVQPAASVATRASAETPERTRLMNAPPERCSNQGPEYAREVPRSAGSGRFS
jgi:hypothetical protein